MKCAEEVLHKHKPKRVGEKVIITDPENRHEHKLSKQKKEDHPEDSL